VCPPRTYRHLRLTHLVADVLGAVGIREGGEPGDLVFLEDPELDSRNCADGGRDAECSELDEPGPGYIRHHNEDCPEHQRGAEVRLHEDQQRGDGEDAQGLEEDRVLPHGLLGGVPCQHYHHAQFGELRGLHLHGPDIHPALGPTGGGPHHHHRGEHQENEDVD
jgi:hypothetical protein